MNNIDIEISKKEIKNILEKLKELNHVISFTFENFDKHKNDEKLIIDKDYWIGINLIESYTKELLEIVSFKSSLIEDHKNRYEKIKEANQKIMDLEKKLGQKVDIEDISYGIKNYVKEIEQKLFGYSKISFNQYGGIKFDISYRAIFSSLHNYEEEDNGYKNLLNKLKKDLCLDLIENKDGYKEEIHYDILDTENNRIALENFFINIFGTNTKIIEFNSSRKRGHNKFIIEGIKGYTDFMNIYLS